MPARIARSGWSGDRYREVAVGTLVLCGGRICEARDPGAQLTRLHRVLFNPTVRRLRDELPLRRFDLASWTEVEKTPHGAPAHCEARAPGPRQRAARPGRREPSGTTPRARRCRR